MSTPANRKRATERAVCRRALSDHLYTTLSIAVLPSNVRLHPLQCDPYRWQYNEGYGHIFEKNLSDLSTNNYIEISEGLRNGQIWAVQVVCDEHGHPQLSGNTADATLQKQLEELKQERARLLSENEQLKKHLQHRDRALSILHLSLSKAEQQASSVAHVMKQLKKAMNGHIIE